MEQDKKEQIKRNAEAIMEMAGCKVSHKYDEDLMDMLDGKVTVDEVIAKILGNSEELTEKVQRTFYEEDPVNLPR